MGSGVVEVKWWGSKSEGSRDGGGQGNSKVLKVGSKCGRIMGALACEGLVCL